MKETVNIYNHNLSIYERRIVANGQEYRYFFGRVTLDDGARKEFSGNSREQVIAKAYIYFRSIETDSPVQSEPILFKDWADLCFERFFHSKEPTTVRAWQRYNNYLKDDLGEIYVQILTSDRLQKTIDGLTIAPTSIHTTYSLLNRYMQAAVNESVIPANPASNLALPLKEIHHNEILNSNDIEALFRECDKDLYGDVYILFLLCAFRLGECLGLTDDEIHEDRGSITISHQFRCETRSFEKTKTKKERTIYPPGLAFEIIRRQREKRTEYAKSPDYHNDSNVLFCKPDGSPLNGHYVQKRFKAIARRIGRPELHLHDLRRSSASVALYLSNAPTAVQNLLGHSALGMTYYYCDATQEQMEEFSSVQNDYYNELYKKASENI